MLGTHYRQPIDWTQSALEEAEAIHADWSEVCTNAPVGNVSPAVIAAILDDLNTPKALAELHALRRAGDGSALHGSLSFLGIGLIFQVTLVAKVLGRAEMRGEVISSDDARARIERITLLVAERNNARKSKNFKESDRIRDELAAMGVVLKDSKDGTTWEVADRKSVV